MGTVKSTDRIGVFLAPVSGDRPTLADYDPSIIALSWSVVAGSGLWKATFTTNLGLTSTRLKDMAVTFSSNRQVEIWKLTDDVEVEEDDPSFRERLLFWGEMLGHKIEISGRGEGDVLTAAIMPYHFGEVVSGQKVIWRLVPEDTVDSSIVTIPIPIEFQPQVDGKICDNRFKADNADSEDERYFWIDPESVRTDGAKALQKGTVSEWTLATMAESMCLHFNADQDFIKNANHSEHATVMGSAPKIKHLVYEYGNYLPAYLDAMCNSQGYGWCVDCLTSVSGLGDGPLPFPVIRFYQQQSGDSKTVKMQDVGETMDLANTNTHQLSMDVNIGQLSNVIRGVGALIEREFTIPLYRTWPVEDDEEPQNYAHENPHNPIGRKWAANEAGDYLEVVADEIVGIREEIPNDPPDFGTDWVPKRRVLEDCLTLRDGKRRPVYLQYREDSEATWKDVPNEWGYRVLHDEVGIWFTGQRQEGSTAGGIPEEVLTDTVELRVTGTLRGDKRVEYRTSTSVISPNSNVIEETIDLSDRYFDRKRETSGEFASTLSGDQDNVDDTTAIQTYITEVKNKSDLADSQAEVHLIGLHYSFNADGSDDAYKIGDIITKLEGREISFNRAASPVGAKYLQVVGITWINEPGNQSTVLFLSPTGVS